MGDAGERKAVLDRQYHGASESTVEAELRRRGFDTEVRRAGQCTDDLTGTRRIVRKILESMGEAQ